MRLDKLTQIAVNALEDVKGRDIKVFDVKKMTAIFDHVIVATGDSNRQCRALANRVREMVKEAGGTIYGIEGEQTGEWLLVDIGATVVHIMQPAIRQYYNLEELWAPPPKAAKAPTAKKAPAIKKAAKLPKSTKSPGEAKKTRSTKVPASPKAAPRKAAKARKAPRAASAKRRTAA
jgi:ribosome-associated protein